MTRMPTTNKALQFIDEMTPYKFAVIYKSYFPKVLESTHAACPPSAPNAAFGHNLSLAGGLQFSA